MVSPFDTAWSVLKALSRQDLEEASRTGGIERLGFDTMRPEISSLNMGAIAPLTQVLPTEPRFSGPRTEQADIQQELNEAMFPDEEAEHRRINAPTPVSMPGTIAPNRRFLEQRLQDMGYPLAQMRAAGMHPETHLPMRDLMQERMKLMHRIGQRPAPQPGAPMPVGEAGDASMPDPSQMEHLGAQLAHADMMRDDINPAASVPLQIEGEVPNLRFPNLQSHFSRAPNRAALSELGTHLNANEIMARQSGLTTEDIEMLRRL